MIRFYQPDEGAALAFICPVCGDGSEKKPILSTGRASVAEFDVHHCASCASLVFRPFPEIDYRAHTSSDRSIKNYVEHGAAPDLIARNIFRTIDDGTSGRLLDIGCGYGFGLHFAKIMFGWEVKGYEPSEYGERGRNELKVDIVRDFAQANTSPDELYNTVHCSEVIEHVQEPGVFLDILVSYLALDGVLVMTTPNPKFINESTDRATAIALLSPGAHTILYGRKALSQLLDSRGLSFQSIDESGPSTIVFASRKALRLRAVEEMPLYFRTYLQVALVQAKSGGYLETGLRYRLFRHAVEHDLPDLADHVFRPFLATRFAEVGASLTLDDLIERFPACIGASTYYYAMQLMRHRRSFDEAADYFRDAFSICVLRYALLPTASVVEADLVWRAKFHEALSLYEAGRGEAAMLALEEISPKGEEPLVPANLTEQIESLRRRLIEAKQPPDDPETPQESADS